MVVTYKTIKNTKQTDKPNEDAVLCDKDKNIYILLDGVSRDNENGKYPFPSPAVIAVNILIENIYAELKNTDMNNSDILDSIKHAIQIGNDKLKIFNENNKISFPAGAVGIVAVIQREKLYYGYIGDCYGRLIYANTVQIFTKCQTELISKHKKQFTTYEIREIICNNIDHPYSYGVLNGDKRAMNFVKRGEINLSEVEQIILASDGMENYLSICSLELLKEKSASDLVDEAVAINGNAQDDRTIIKIEREKHK